MEKILDVLNAAVRYMTPAEVADKAGLRSVAHTKLCLNNMVGTGQVVERKDGRTNPVNGGLIVEYRAASRPELDTLEPPAAKKKPAVKKVAKPAAYPKPTQPGLGEALAQAEASAAIRGENVAILNERLDSANHELIARASRIGKLESELYNLAALNVKLEHLLNSSRNEAAMLRQHAAPELARPEPFLQAAPAVKFGTLYLERMPSMSEIERQAFGKMMLALSDPPPFLYTSDKLEPSSLEN